MGPQRLQFAIRAATVVGIVLLVAAGASLTVRKTQYDRLITEYEASRLATQLFEQLAEDATITRLPEQVRGFSVFGADGSVIAAFGRPITLAQIDERLDPTAFGEHVYRAGNQLTFVRSVGAGRLAGGGRGTAQQGGGRVVVALVYDLSIERTRERLENGLLIAIGVFVVASMIALGLLVRRYQYSELQRERNYKLAQLGQAARTLAHEIRNPLTAVQMQTTLIRRSNPYEDHSRLDVIDEELDRIRDLTENVRSFLKGGPGNAQPVAIVDAVGEAVAAFGVAVRIDSHVDDELTVPFDPGRFRSLIENLVRNAVESGPDEPVSVTVSATASQVIIEVADRGSGLTSSLTEQLFDPFFTTKDTGSGLGLAMSKHFVEAAGGSIELSDRVGGGTLAVVRIPMEQQ